MHRPVQLSPERINWRVLPFSPSAAAHIKNRLRELAGHAHKDPKQVARRNWKLILDAANYLSTGIGIDPVDVIMWKEARDLKLAWFDELDKLVRLQREPPLRRTRIWEKLRRLRPKSGRRVPKELDEILAYGALADQYRTGCTRSIPRGGATGAGGGIS